MSYQSEAQLEERLIEKLETLRYTRVIIKDYDELVSNFRVQINEFNKSVLNNKPLSDTEFTRVINYLVGKSVLQSAKQLRDKFVLDRDDGTTCYISFLSEVNDQNIYQVTNQVTVKGKYKNRYDVTLLVNGLPLVQIELKKSSVDIKQAINQIDRYRIHSYKGLFKYVQIYIVSNGVETRYFSNTDEKRIMKSLTFYWTDEANNRVNRLEAFSESFLNHSRLIRMISRYMVINDTEKQLMVMRPYQIFATEKLLQKALETNKGGYVWHTTGSGKTLTSFKCAQLLVQDPRIKKVFFLVDRSDLDAQTMQEFNKFEEGCVDYTNRTNVLVKQIKDTNTKLICSTIQKMAIAVKSPRYASVMDAWRDEKVIFIIDECHRSQFGKMHNDVKKHFRNAQYFGFTGTPRFKENKSADGRTTADIFGECLHAYMIKNAIFDRNVLGFNVEYITTYKGQYDEDDPTKVEGIDTKEVFESDERVALIVEHILQHHKQKSRIGANKYTALFATSSIPMLVKYYDEFKKHDHNLKIAAIFSYGANEDLDGKDEHSRDSLERIIDDYNKMFDTNFSTDTYQAYNVDVSKRLKVKKIPEIDLLIVVNMYLTGFDSKPLNTLYVDKNLEWHSLLQAFSRTNRVEFETKQFGNIVCYRNLKSATDKALTLFSGGGDIEGVLLKPYEHYLEQFKLLCDELHKWVHTADDVDKLESEEDQAKFVIAFRELSKVLLTMQTFMEFDWADIEDWITQKDYDEIKGRYLTIYDNLKVVKDAEKVSILDDIDFSIDLVETDRINVAYIMNLLRNIDFSDDMQKEKDIAHIYDELERSDSPELKRKVDLIKLFLGDVVPLLDSGSEVDEAYEEFEEKKRNEEIKAYADENELDEIILKDFISEYEFSGIVSEADVEKSLISGKGFRERRRLRKEIISYIVENCNKYMS